PPSPDPQAEPTAGLPRPASGRRAMLSAVFVLGFVAIYFLARLPFLSDPLYCEEGIFAAIVVNQPPNPDYLLVARIDGQEHYQRSAHPAPLYETMKLAAKLWPPVGPQSVHDDTLATPRLRFFFCLFQLVAWLGVGLLALLVTRASGVVVQIATIVIVAAAAASPIAVVTSTELQVDGSVGALMVGVMAAATCLAARGVLPVSVTYATLFIAAAVLGLGKQEWSLALVAALGLWFPALFALRKWTGRTIRLHVVAAAVILVGLLLGNLLSYLYDPENWLGGIGVMRRIAGRATIATGAGTSHWLEVTAERLNDLATIFALGVCLLILLARHIKTVEPYALLGLFLAGGLFGGYFISSWASYPRYFAPSLLAMAFTLLAVLPANPDRVAQRVLLATAMVLVLHSAVFIAGRIGSTPRQVHLPESVSRECVSLLQAGDVWNKPDIDFVARSLGPEGAKAHLARYGKTLCE
ncbi:MAG: hypothetical protein O6933_03685, partial [Planctomycetota bacterium]|nr:hypothetical protein [Planctomycetota bacterium]